MHCRGILKIFWPEVLVVYNNIISYLHILLINQYEVLEPANLTKILRGLVNKVCLYEDGADEERTQIIYNHKWQWQEVSHPIIRLNCYKWIDQLTSASVFKYQESSVTVINTIVAGNDTDLLVIMIDRSCPNLFMQYNHDAVYNIKSIKHALSDRVSDHLLAAHAITGCDTVSAMYNVGKRAPIRELKSKDCTFHGIYNRRAQLTMK